MRKFKNYYELIWSRLEEILMVQTSKTHRILMNVKLIISNAS